MCVCMTLYDGTVLEALAVRPPSGFVYCAHTLLLCVRDDIGIIVPVQVLFLLSYSNQRIIGTRK